MSSHVGEGGFGVGTSSSLAAAAGASCTQPSAMDANFGLSDVVTKGWQEWSNSVTRTPQAFQ